MEIKTLFSQALRDKAGGKTQGGSSCVFKGKPRNLREAGEQLHADYILEGSVLRAGQQLRINAQSVRVRDDFPIWSGRFNRELTDVVAARHEISRGIVNSLRLKLGRGRRRYETSVEAYELYLRDRSLPPVGQMPPGVRRHNPIPFQDVIAKNPAFAPAYAALAEASLHWRVSLAPSLPPPLSAAWPITPASSLWSTCVHPSTQPQILAQGVPGDSSGPASPTGREWHQLARTAYFSLNPRQPRRSKTILRPPRPPHRQRHREHQIVMLAPAAHHPHDLQLSNQPLGLPQPLANLQLPGFQHHLDPRQQIPPRNIATAPPARAPARRR